MEFDYNNPVVIAASIAMGFIVAAFLMCFWRLVKGPTLPDRVVAVDLLAIYTLALCAVYTLLSGNPVYLDVALVLALTAFLSTVALALYLERRMDK